MPRECGVSRVERVTSKFTGSGLVVKLFAVFCFFAGVLALAGLVIRRGRQIPTSTPDYLLMFVGLAGLMTGLILLFNRS